MRVTTSKSKNAESFYISKGYVNDKGVSTSVIIRKLGTLKDLLPEHGPTRDDVMVWAKEQARIETLKYKREKEEKQIKLTFHADRPLDYDKQVFYRGGYLFLQSIYYQLQINKICRKLKQKHKFKYDINAILSDMIYARILEPRSKRSSYKAASEFLEKPSYKLHDVYRALDVLGAECDLIQAELYKNSHFLGARNDKVLYYDCSNYYFEIEQEDGNKKYGKSKEHRPNPIIQMDLFMDGDGFKRVSDDKSVDISKLPEDDKGLYYKDEPYTTKKLQQRLIITYSPKYALYQKSIRSKQIERAQAMLDSGNTKRTAGTQTIQPDLLEQQQLQKKVRLPIFSIILMNI